MNEDSWMSSPAMQRLLRELVGSTVKQYQIDAGKAEEILARSLAADQRLCDLAAKEEAAEQIKRTRVFKNAAATAKKSVYFALRRYRPDSSHLERLIQDLSNLPVTVDERELARISEQICQLHASTRERRSHASEFYEQLFRQFDGPVTLIDVGCGMQPLQFPFSSAPKSLQQYVAFDKDVVSIDAVLAYAQHQRAVQLTAFRQDLRDGWGDCCNRCGVEYFDVAMILKLVPVVHRQARELLGTLAETPAKKWIVSGSKHSMTKRRDITRREETVIRSFIESSDRRVVAEFTLDEEFVFVVE